MTKPFLQTLRCAVSTLSPVHIGCGDDYYPTNYVIDNGNLHHFAEDGLLAALTLPERKELGKLAEQAGDDGIKKLQAFIHGKKDHLQLYATHTVPVSAELETFYKSRIGQTQQHEARGRNVDNKLEIARHAFNPYTQTPYFPGSSIKGAIRTALLNARNGGKPLPFRVYEDRDVPRGEGDKLQKRLLEYQSIADDPLRLLKIGDAAYHDADELHGLEIRFAVNQRKKGLGPYQILECLPAHRSRGLSFDIQFLADQKLNYRWAIADIAKACNDFFLPQLEQELQLMQNRNYADPIWASGLEKLLAGELGEVLAKQQAFLLRIGRHGGAESNTLDGVRHIHIPQLKKYLPKPTTIWLAGDNKDQQRGLLPFGWVLVETNATGLTQTQQFLHQQAQPDYQRRQNLQALAAQRAEFLRQQQEKQAKQAAQAAEAAEQERLRQQAEDAQKQALAAMTVAQQQVFALWQQYELAKTRAPEPNGTLRQLLTDTIKQSADWPPEDKQALWQIGNELCGFWGKPKKLKDQLKALQS